MKTTLTKKIFQFILIMTGMFYSSLLLADCPGNKVYVCRYDSCGGIECKCIQASQVAAWQAVTPPCPTFHWHPHCCDGFRIGNQEPVTNAEAMLQVYPNPVVKSTIVSFSLEQPQHASLRLFDMNGRLVSVLADNSFEAGSFEIPFNVDDVNAGVYFIQFKSDQNSRMIRLTVTK